MSVAIKGWSGTNLGPSSAEALKNYTREFEKVAKAMQRVTVLFDSFVPTQSPDADMYVINETVERVQTSWKTAWMETNTTWTAPWPGGRRGK